MHLYIILVFITMELSGNFNISQHLKAIKTLNIFCESNLEINK